MEIKIPIMIDDKALEEAFDRRFAELKKEGDFVLVTRCRACKYYNNAQCYHPRHDHHGQSVYQEADDFCSYAEPKDIEGSKE